MKKYRKPCDIEQTLVSSLQEKGYRIIKRNWRFGKKEIDIISEKVFPVKAQTLALRLEPFALLWLTDRSDHRNLKDSLDKKAEPAGNTEH